MTDPTGLDQLDKAKSAADHLLVVINDILDLSRIEAERMVLEDEPLQLSRTVERAIQHFDYPEAMRLLRETA